ncbi:hypothetical protein HCX48_13075 [Rhodocyclus tenuis]|uniref:Uncharacterized protein n=1 Tax=Rhodocyclus gracilis TaxID=2929842 RepID=A0ABX0WK98_9RHOO|nr:hypothetical protein [Rhodocyclus gracilis]
MQEASAYRQEVSLRHAPPEVETTSAGFLHANIELIRKAQIVVANLDPFRGPDPDRGTAFELGYAHQLSKKHLRESS